MRRRTFAMNGGKRFPPLVLIRPMQKKKLSVFVDESGKFQYPDAISRFYIVSLVLHDQSVEIGDLVRKLDVDWVRMGYEDFCFHAGPLIRKEKGYMYMPREERAAIFSRMLLFARQMEFRFRCLVVDKEFVTSSRQIIERLQRQLNEFLDSSRELLFGVDEVKVYYDCGQAPVTKLLQDTFMAHLGTRITFAQGVKPENYKLFQLADLVCTAKLAQLKISQGVPLTVDEFKFYGGPRRFMRNVWKQFAAKEMI